MIAETVVETDLLPEPDDLSSSQGRLPEGTLLRLLGKRVSGFENVEVELVDRIAEGWIRRKDLNLKAQEEQNEKWDKREKRPRRRDNTDAAERKRREDRIYVPKDEVLLIRRTPSFFYGLVGEVPLAYISNSANDFFSGLNFRIGAHIGFFITQSMPLRFEVAYARMAGSADAASPAGAGATMEVGFVDLRTQLEVQFGSFLALGLVQYSFGAGVGSAPATPTFGSAGSLSSFWLGAGGGYRIGFSDGNSIVLQATYSMSLLRDPVGFQAIGFRILWEVRG